MFGMTGVCSILFANRHFDHPRETAAYTHGEHKLRQTVLTECVLMPNRPESIHGRRFVYLHVKIYGRLGTECILAKHRFRIDNTDTTDLHEPAREFRRAPPERSVAVKDLDDIIGNELMTPAYEIECTFRLTCPRLPDNEHARVEHAHQYAMDLKGRGLRFLRIGCQISALHSWSRFDQTVVTILACVNY